MGNKVTKSNQQLRRGELWKMNRQLVMGRADYFLAQVGFGPFIFWPGQQNTAKFWWPIFVLILSHSLTHPYLQPSNACLLLLSGIFFGWGLSTVIFWEFNLPTSLLLHCISHAIAAAYTFESFPLYHTIWQLEGIFILTWQIYSIIEIFFENFSHFFYANNYSW